jgi:hypothetical protein
MTEAERIQAWLDIPDDNPFASPLGYQQWLEETGQWRPAPARTTRRQARWGRRQGSAGYGRQRRG